MNQKGLLRDLLGYVSLGSSNELLLLDTPEKKLMFAVLWSAIFAYYKPQRTCSGWTNRTPRNIIYNELNQFFFQAPKDSGYLFTFENILEHISPNPDHLRKHIWQLLRQISKGEIDISNYRKGREKKECRRKFS